MDVSAVFTAMIDERENYGITEWGITQTTLEDVFVRVSSAAGFMKGRTDD